MTTRQSVELDEEIQWLYRGPRSRAGLLKRARAMNRIVGWRMRQLAQDLADIVGVIKGSPKLGTPTFSREIDREIRRVARKLLEHAERLGKLEDTIKAASEIEKQRKRK